MNESLFSLDPYIIRIPDFPRASITFYDRSPALEDDHAFAQITVTFCIKAYAYETDLLVGIDERGFLFGAAAAVPLGFGLVMVRKTGKQPSEAVETSYSPKYCEALLALQTARNMSGKRILLCDDLLATGGTHSATAELIHKVDGVVCGAICPVELTGLKGRDKLFFPVSVLQSYEC